jgi:ribosome-associated translation inhibitor RaiA
MNKKVIIIILALVVSIMAILYFKGAGNYFNSGNVDNPSIVNNDKNNSRDANIPAKDKQEIEKKSRRFIRVYKTGGADNIETILKTENLISKEMRINLAGKLNKLRSGDAKSGNSGNKSQYALEVEPLQIFILDFEKNRAKVEVQVKITKTYGYLDENWITLVWRNPDGTIGDPQKEIFTQEVILDFVKFYNWRINKAEFLEGSKKIIYENKVTK